jgi:hypothetical protein
MGLTLAGNAHEPAETRRVGWQHAPRRAVCAARMAGVRGRLTGPHRTKFVLKTRTVSNAVPGPSTVDGQPVSGGTVPLLNDGREHNVRVELG